MTTPSWAPTPAVLRQLMFGRDLKEVEDEALQGFVDRVAGSLVAEVGTPIEDRWFPVAGAYVLYAAAAQVELGLFPEQSVGTDGPAARYDRLAGAELARMRRATDPDGDGDPATSDWAGSMAHGYIGR